ncbi:carboxypeptidase regulatory-like domain-containing protein [Brevibacillus fortis]|uniref:carboxypeptidase regulatory-like domain-containing protein n=1 Tax=Brevibacillus fortis TaxID=2126352 RepID=UPI002E20A60B|nr:carboxypeptidase regulatory-like domain-containing protein [Brevibacillus fortis]
MAYPSDSQFIPFMLGGSPFGDVPNDENPGSVDLVGNSTFPVAFLAYDGTYLYFRMRVNEDPRNSQKTGFRNFAWGYLINAAGAAGTYQWMLGVQGLRNRIALIQNTVVEFNSWNDPAEGTNGSGAPNWQAPIINFDTARVRLTNDGSSFSGDPDYFIDLVMPAATFFSTIGVTSLTSLCFLPFTSTNENNYNKDSLRVSEGFSFENSLSNTTTVATGDVRASLAIDKQVTAGPVVVTTGQLSQWTGSITVTNTGKSQAATVVVNDLIELDQVTAFTVNATSTGAVSYNPLTKVLSWKIGNLAAGSTASLSFTVSGVFAISPGGTRRLNTATVTGVDSFSGGTLSPIQDNIVITVNLAGSIAGVVLDQSTNLPVAGAHVDLYDSIPVLIGTTTTDTDGAYSFTGLAPSLYSVSVTAPTYDPKIQFVSVLAGQTTRADILLPPSPGQVNGTITDTGLAPISGAVVKLINTTGVTVNQTVTGVGGTYQFTNVMPGAYTLAVSADTFQPATVAINVIRAQTTTQNVGLQTSVAELSGLVTGPGGIPIAGALVEVLNQAGITLTETTTDGAGTYLLTKLAEGVYQIRVSAAGFSTQLAGISLQAGDAKVLNFSLTTAFGTVSGTISDAQTGEGTPNASIKVVTRSGIAVGETLTDINGDYSLSLLGPETYVLTAAAEGYAGQTVGVEITAGATTTVDLQLEKQAGVLMGTVSDTGGNAFADAVVVVLKGIVPVAQTITDSTGTFSFPHLAPDTYTVTASATGYSTAVLGATVLPQEISFLDFVLQASPGAITGQVIDSSNQPIQGATVIIRENTAAGAAVATVLTDGNGQYVVPDLLPQAYVVNVSAPDKTTVITGAIVTSLTTTTVNVQLADLPGSISGSIFDATSGLPITGASVEVSVLNQAGAIVAHANSDLAGNYEITGLARGVYTITARATNYETNSASAIVFANTNTPVSLSLFASPGEIQGQVVAAGTLQPIAGAQVNTLDSNGSVVHSVYSDSQGSFVITGLAAGQYVIIASADGFQSNHVGAIVLANTTTPVQLQLNQDFGFISGAVAPVVPGTTIQLFDINNLLIGTAVADGNGTFSISGVAPGSYVLTATASGYAVQSVGAIVQPGQTANVSFTLTPNPASISGTVRDTGMQPIVNAVVRILDLNETTIGFGYTDSNGGYTIGNLPAGSFIVVASAPEYVTSSIGASLGPGENKTGDFTLGANAGGISGQVTDATNPTIFIAGAVVLIRSISDGNVVATASTDQTGSYLIEHLLPGAYTVTVSAPSYADQSVGANVITGETTGASVALLPLPGSIVGSVINCLGVPVTGSEINVKLMDSNQAVIQSLLANESGVFFFASVAPGVYTVIASAPGYAVGSIGVIVAANTATSTTVTLPDLPAAISGVVTNQMTGFGIPGSTVLITDDHGVVLAQLLTDEQGNFLAEKLPPGVVNVTVSAPNFVSVSQAVILQGGITTNFQQALVPNPGSLSGVVTDLETGLPITGATVIVYDSTRAAVGSVLTGAAGNYSFDRLAPGGYTVNVNASGYASDVAGAQIQAGAMSTLSFALQGLPGAIVGTVREQGTALPIAGAVITVRQGSPSGTILSIVQADEQGKYMVSGLPPGSYTLIATASGFAAEASTVMVGLGATTGLDFSLPSLPASVTGEITDALLSTPLPNTLVRLLGNNNTILFATQTDAQGIYFIDGFAAGNYTVLARNDNYQRENASFDVAPGGTATVNIPLNPNPGILQGAVRDAFDGTPLVGAEVLIFFPGTNNLLSRAITDGLGQFTIDGLAPLTYTLAISALNYATQPVGATIFSGQTTVIDVGLPPFPATVTGQVQATGGGVVPNALIQVKDSHGTLFGSAITDDLGNFSVGNLPPGAYVISASEDSYAAATSNITVTAGQTISGVILTMSPLPGSISGQVTNQLTGLPITGAAVAIQLFSNGLFVANTVTNQSGQFQVNGLTAGEYNVIASADGFGTHYRTVTVVNGQTTVTTVELLPIVGTISGMVLLPDGTQASGNNIQLSLFHSNQIRLQNILAEPDGTFHFVNVAPGTYTVIGSIPGIGTGQAEAVVLPNQTTFITIRLSQTGTIQGTVRSGMTGSPVAGATVNVQAVNQAIRTTVVVQTDSFGRYKVTDLAPGTYLVVANAMGSGEARATVTLGVGEIVTLDLVLVPAAMSGSFRVATCPNILFTPF